jgi:hypothetical protein
MGASNATIAQTAKPVVVPQSVPARAPAPSVLNNKPALSGAPALQTTSLLSRPPAITLSSGPPTPTPAAVTPPAPPAPSIPSPPAVSAPPPPPVSPPAVSSSTPALPGGSPLAPEIRKPLEKSFSTNLQDVRVHSDVGAHNVAHSLSTRAVTYGSDIFLGRGERPTDMRVMAHEAAHVVQQRGAPATAQPFSPGSDGAYEAEAEQASAAVLRGESFTVQQQTGPRPQGLLGIDLPDPLDWLANKANIIPGFRLLTIILGVNPINMSPVARSGANILRAMIEILPGGGLVSQALESSGIFEKAGAFVEKQISSLGMTGSAIKTAVTSFIKNLSLRRIITDPGGVWDSAKSIFTAPIDQIKNFWVGLVTGLVELVKEAILKPIAKLAEGTEGYNLLKGILGKDPITNEPVTRSAETLLGPLLKMIGLGDVWQKMQDAKAIPRAWAWFQSTMGSLLAIVSAIPPAFIGVLKSLTLEDIILIPKAFIKLGKVFVGFMAKFVSWGVDAMWELLKIVFDVVSPGAFGYIQKTGAALKSILKNPLPFVGNLAKAAMLGFKNFGANFLTHLKNGLIDWLTGSLSGIYIPKALTLLEFGKMALSVLGLSWAQIRGKIVKALGPHGELIMQGLEAVFDVVKALINGGPAAAWEVIKDKLTSLKDTIVSGITSMVVEAVVTKGIPKLVAMFIPGAGFISAIISIYDMIMVFVNKISQIIAVVTSFIDSIVAIAAGNIGAAAGKVEGILARLLSLAINFLAGFAGLGKVANKVRGIVDKVRGTVDKALDAGIAFLINKAKALFKYLFGPKGPAPGAKPGDAADPAAVKAKVRADLSPRLKGIQNAAQLQAVLNSTYSKFQGEGLKRLEVKRSGSKAVFEVIAYASAGDPAGSVEVAAKLMASDLIPERPITVLVYSINGVDKGRIENAEDEEETGKRQHAEVIMLGRLAGEMPAIEAAKPGGPHLLEVNLTRSPCGACSGRLQSFIAKNNIKLTLRLLSLYKGKAGGGAGAARRGLKDLMMNPNVEVQRWDAWAYAELKKHGLEGQIPKDLELRLSKRLGDLIIAMDDIKKAAAGGNK